MKTLAFFQMLGVTATLLGAMPSSAYAKRDLTCVMESWVSPGKWIPNPDLAEYVEDLQKRIVDPNRWVSFSRDPKKDVVFSRILDAKYLVKDIMDVCRNQAGVDVMHDTFLQLSLRKSDEAARAASEIIPKVCGNPLSRLAGRCAPAFSEEQPADEGRDQVVDAMATELLDYIANPAFDDKPQKYFDAVGAVFAPQSRVSAQVQASIRLRVSTVKSSKELKKKEKEALEIERLIQQNL